MRSESSATMRCVSLALIASLLLAGCGRTYIFGPDQMPVIADGELHLREFQRSHAPLSSFAIERIGLRHHADNGLLRTPTEQEFAALVAGHPLDVHTIEVDVDASHAHWRDYGLAGAGVGVTLGLVASLSQDNDALFGNSNSLMLLGSLTLGFAGFLAGLIGGSLAAPDMIDMRYQHNPEFD